MKCRRLPLRCTEQDHDPGFWMRDGNRRGQHRELAAGLRRIAKRQKARIASQSQQLFWLCCHCAPQLQYLPGIIRIVRRIVWFQVRRQDDTARRLRKAVNDECERLDDLRQAFSLHHHLQQLVSTVIERLNPISFFHLLPQLGGSLDDTLFQQGAVVLNLLLKPGNLPI